MTAKEEYENFLEYYYFDYNILNSIISFWENTDNPTYKTSYSLFIILTQFYDLNKTCIPYSMAHIWDIINGTKKYADKVNFIDKISKRWYVSEDIDNNLIRIDKCDNISDHFDEVFESMKMTDEIRSAFDPLIELGFEKSLKNDDYSKMVNFEYYNKMIEIYKQKKVKSIYDIFQFNYKMINIMNVKNNLNVNIVSKEELIKNIEKFMLNNNLLSSINVKSIAKFENFYNKNLLNFQQSEFSKKIFMYSFLCDYVGVTKESKNKVNKDTFASGMINDLIHLSIGLRCPNFITNDKNLKTKAVICKKLLNLNVRIFDNENFCQYLINQYVKINFPKKDQKEFKISIELNNEKYQKTFIIDFNKTLYQ
ncbi:MAG: hypothetical protein FWC91_14575 [Defluviitaleaceae bacterium]|nr:hypothetical protein [Defluviitaleaceae bacterium]